MYSLFTVFIWCALCFLIGCALTMICVIRLFLHAYDDYSEADDFPDAEWTKDFEELKDERQEVYSQE